VGQEASLRPRGFSSALRPGVDLLLMLAAGRVFWRGSLLVTTE
jgi:hypothetical protein